MIVFTEIFFKKIAIKYYKPDTLLLNIVPMMPRNSGVPLAIVNL